MTEDDLKQFLEDNKTSILEATRLKIIERVTAQMEYSLPKTYSETVSEFMAKEIAPEIAKQLADTKGAILQATAKASAQIGDEIAKVMLKKSIDVLNGYSGSKILQQLMGAY